MPGGRPEGGEFCDADGVPSRAGRTSKNVHPKAPGTAVRDRVKQIDPAKRLNYAADRADRVASYDPKKPGRGNTAVAPRAPRNDGGFSIMGTGRFSLDQYDGARHLAQTQANDTGKDYAIRKMKNGLTGRHDLVVSRASWNDSDYNRYEIVKPETGGGHGRADQHIDALSKQAGSAALPDLRQMQHQTNTARQASRITPSQPPSIGGLVQRREQAVRAGKTADDMAARARKSPRQAAQDQPHVYASMLANSFADQMGLEPGNKWVAGFAHTLTKELTAAPREEWPAIRAAYAAEFGVSETPAPKARRKKR